MGMVVSIPLTLLAVASAGAGHGNYLWAKVFFPFTMLSTAVFQSITTFFLAVAVIQFPIYGLLIGRCARQRKALMASGVILSVHLIAIGLAFYYSSRNFI
jgi:hypothetical protein